MSVKSIFGVTLSIAWLFIYAGGGAFLLARHATANIDRVSPSVPVFIFLWIVGFFVGHIVIEKFCSFVFQLGKSNVSDGQFLQAVNIDNLRPVYANKNALNFFEYGQGSSTHHNKKKDTCKIIAFFKPRVTIYKIPAAGY